MDSPDLLISAVEVNNHHGVGILLQRFFPDSSGIITLRSRSLYGGQESFGQEHWELRSQFRTVPDTRSRLADLLAGRRIRRILCVPYYREDFIHGILAKELTGAPLCTFIMDDQTVFTPQVPAHWPARLLASSDLRLGISPELCAAYARRFSYPLELLPPVVTKAVPLIPCYWETEPGEPLRAAMLGNVWTAARFDQLRELTRATGLHIDWYGNGTQAPWLTGAPEEWEVDHIRTMGFLPEEDLIAALASYPFIVVPSGSLDQHDDNPAFSHLSLPSRLVFLHTATDTPVLLLGSPDTAAGRFLCRLGTGQCCAYQPHALIQTIQALTNAAVRRKIQQAIRHWSPALVLPDAGEWIWSSLAKGTSAPTPFHAAFPPETFPPGWLERIEPFATSPWTRPSPANDTPAPLALVHLRNRHHGWAVAQGMALPSLEEIELGVFLRAAVATGALTATRTPGDFLILDDAAGHWTHLLNRGHRLWHPANTNDWLVDRENFHAIEALGAATPSSGVPEKFDAILSGSWLDQVTTAEQLACLVARLKRHIKPGGLNLHGATAVIHPDYFWTGPAAAFLRDAFGLASWELDSLLADPDLYTMSRKAYDLQWAAVTKRPYDDFGRPVALLLAWSAPPAPSALSVFNRLRAWLRG